MLQILNVIWPAAGVRYAVSTQFVSETSDNQWETGTCTSGCVFNYLLSNAHNSTQIAEITLCVH
jgi:hypothetical protein